MPNLFRCNNADNFKIFYNGLNFKQKKGNVNIKNSQTF